uniref:Uncharacterized protein n=1 Tax=Anguilla anguilla TaxID=7936 RepID=A0A0E9T7P6_ANGAN
MHCEHPVLEGLGFDFTKRLGNVQIGRLLDANGFALFLHILGMRARGSVMF